MRRPDEGLCCCDHSPQAELQVGCSIGDDFQRYVDPILDPDRRCLNPANFTARGHSPGCGTDCDKPHYYPVCQMCLAGWLRNGTGVPRWPTDRNCVELADFGNVPAAKQAALAVAARVQRDEVVEWALGLGDGTDWVALRAWLAFPFLSDDGKPIPFPRLHGREVQSTATMEREEARSYYQANLSPYLEHPPDRGRAVWAVMREREGLS